MDAIAVLIPCYNEARTVAKVVQDYRTVTLVDLRYVSSQILDQFIDFHGQDVLFLYSPSVFNNSTMLK